MISKISITALVATCLMVGSNASPCRVSSRTTQIPTSLTTKATSAATGTAVETTFGTIVATENTISSTTALSSTEELTITVTESISGTQATSTLEESITTTDESTATVEPTTTEAATTSDEPTTTAAASTTTAEAPADPTHITNGGFEDSSESVSPWELFQSADTSVAVDTNVRNDGQNSARLSFSVGKVNYLRQPLQSISAGVSYTASAWIRPHFLCTSTYIVCAYRTTGVSSRLALPLTVTDGSSWQQLSLPCSYTQAQLDEGNLYLYVGYNCPSGSTSYIDSVDFTLSLA
ncbi:hypothetical protein HG530_003957 [Fusarium avenaceum]|nr:hypothetical protein HG530_003957 [Fusarium avenaceum]